MKSKKPFFSKEIIWNNIVRFWWISALFTVVLFLSSPLVILTRSGRVDLDDIYEGTVLFLLGVPVFIAVMVFRYMQNPKSMVLMHSMPYTRLRLYVNNLISGLILLLTPILLNTAFLSIIQIGGFGGIYFADKVVLKYLFYSSVVSVTLYSWTVFIGMFTGSSIAQVIFTYIANFLLPGIFEVSQYLFRGVLYGFTMNETFAESLLNVSPLAQAVQFMGYNANFSVKTYFIIDAVICVVFLVAGYFIYKYRNLETAGDVISGKFVKPIFKYGVTICTMIVGAAYLKGIFDIESVNIFGYIIFALIGYVIAEMLLKKSFKIWKSYKGFLVFVAVFIVVALGIKLDWFGYEKYVPDANYVKEAVVSNLYWYKAKFGYGAVYSQENIQKVIALHKKLVENKNEDMNTNKVRRYIEDFAEEKYVQDTNASKIAIRISYKLKDGRKINRLYEVNSDKYMELLNDIWYTEEYIKANNDIFDYETKNIRSIRITNNILNATNFVTIDNKKQIEELLEAAKKDMLNQKPDDNRDMLNLEFTIDENSIPKDGTTHAAIRDYYFSNDAKNILEFLNNNGYSFSIFNTEKVTGIQVDMNNQSKIITDPDKINEIINEIYNSKDVRYYRDNPGYIIIKTFGDENWVAIGENQFSFME